MTRNGGRVRVATWDEVVEYGQPGLRRRGLLAPMAGGAPLTVTAASSSGTTVQAATLGVAVITGAAAVQLNQGATGTQNAGAAPSITLVTKAAGSLILGMVSDWSSNTTPSIPAGQSDTFNGHVFKVNTLAGSSAWAQYVTALTGAIGSSVTINDTSPTADSIAFAAVEIVANGTPAIDASTPPMVVGAATTTNTITTASFTPPNGSLLVALLAIPQNVTDGGQSTNNVTDSAGLSWARLASVGGFDVDAEIWSAYYAGAATPPVPYTPTPLPIRIGGRVRRKLFSFVRSVKYVQPPQAAAQASASDAIGAVTDTARVSAYGTQGADTITVSDQATQTRNLPRSASDTITVSDAAAQTRGQPRAATDSVGAITDTATRTLSLARATSDTVTVSDSAARAALAYSRTATDTLTVADSLAATSHHPRTTTDAIGSLTDSATGQRGVTKTASDTLGTVTDSATRGGVGRPRAAIDTITVADTPAVHIVLQRAIGETIVLSDAATRAVGSGRSAADSLTVTDAAAALIATFVSGTPEAGWIARTGGRVAVARSGRLARA